ncbi:MAG: DUF4105 domain-containing protein [Bacteroidales bacterium]
MKIYKGYKKVMDKLKTVFLCFLLAFLSVTTVNAESKNDSISVSLLTCTPGQRIYELYGHMGIRVKIPVRSFDVVYHYGVFSFNTPNFAYRFVKGETDYSIGVAPYYDFVSMYAMRGSNVRELSLNLTQKESWDLFSALNINTLPSNSEYRYSFLYDNCATRPRDIIAANLSGGIEYVKQSARPTFREMIHNSAVNYPWLTFGIDLVLGDEIDRRVDFIKTPFLPAVTESIIANASVREKNGTLRPLALNEPVTIINPQNIQKSPVTPWIFMPLTVTSFLLVIVVVLSVIEIVKRKHFRWLDTLLFTAYGATGLLIFFLLIFSEHPAVSPNYNAFWLHPFWLVAGVLVWVKSADKFLYYYHFINFALIFGLLVEFGIMSQQINAACIPLMLILMARSVAYIVSDIQRPLKPNYA